MQAQAQDYIRSRTGVTPTLADRVSIALAGCFC